MSAIVVVHIEGVMTDPSDTATIPIASPSGVGLRLVRTLAEAWPIGYVTDAPREKAQAWLEDVSAPTGAWVASAAPQERAAVILGMLAERTDRAQLYVTCSSTGLGLLQENHIPVLVYFPARHTLGDWRAPTVWTNEESA